MENSGSAKIGKISIVIVLLAFIAVCPAFGAGNGTEDVDLLVGSWQGTLKAGASSLRIVFNIEMKNGTYAATMDSPDQGAKGIPVSKVTRSGNAVTFEVKAIKGSFSGQLTADGLNIQGQWKQSGMSFPLSLTKQVAPSLNATHTLGEEQSPDGAVPAGSASDSSATATPANNGQKMLYSETQVRFSSLSSGVELGGTLTLPKGEGPFPAVVLVTGSGAQNRDEEIVGHKPFAVIADYLAGRGIAVLRYDDRGVGESTGNFALANTLDLADDARGALAFLAKTPKIDPERLGVVGHSEGAIIAAVIAGEQGRLASQETLQPSNMMQQQSPSQQQSAVQMPRVPQADFIIMLAGPGVRGDKLLLSQNAAIARASGASEEAIAEANKLNGELYAIALGDDDLAARRQKIIDRLLAWAAQSGQKGAQAEQQAEGLADQLLSPWILGFLSLDPAEYLRSVQIPVLALNGSKDLQVPADENLPAIREALTAAGNGNFKLIRLEGLNHLFQHAQTGLPEEYGRIEETFAPEALAAMGDWILALPR